MSISDMKSKILTTLLFLTLFLSLTFPVLIFGADHTVKNPSLLKEYYWTYGCTPTSAAMVLSYWDGMGFGKLIDYYKIDVCSSFNIPNMLKELKDRMVTNYNEATCSGAGGTDWPNISSGIIEVTNTLNQYSFTSDRYYTCFLNLCGCSDWCWSRITNEIDNDRPVLWSLSGISSAHSLAAWGYRDDKYVVVYDTWENEIAPAGAREDWYYKYYYPGTYDTHENVQYAQVNTVIPGGKSDSDVRLDDPIGGETLTGGSTYKIWWYQWGTQITNVKIYYSTDSGRSWPYTITTVTSSGLGYKSYNWNVPNISSSSVRVRISAYGSSNNLIAGDGSFGDLTISSPPSASITTKSVTPSTITLGQSFTVIVTGKNNGGTAGWGGLSASSPQLVSTGVCPGNSYSGSEATVSGTSALSLGFYHKGCTIYGTGGSMAAQYIIVEGSKTSWASNESQSMTLTVTPKVAGTFPIYIRMALCQDSNCSSSLPISRDPISGSPTDQQGYAVYSYSVTVNPSETVSTSSTPTGTTSGTTGTSYSYTTGGSVSNQGHSVQYFFDWGDGTNSGWLSAGTTSASHSWASAGTYSVKAQARCATHTTVVSSLSGIHTVSISSPTETVSTSSTPTGTTSGTTGTSYSYTTGGSVSNQGHSVQYFFDWGDGTNSGWLSAGTTSASHSWASAGTYSVKAQARCATHTTVVSSWSGIHTVNISTIQQTGTFQLPDTGQTKCYDTAGTQIACAGTGQDGEYSINPMSYTDNANGTVTDNVTGLMWQKEDDNTTRNWTDAGTYCDSSTLGGHTDWRLPTKKELITIVDYSIPDPGPTINTTYFPNTKNARPYWSSTTAAIGTTLAWSVYFGGGSVSYYYKSLGAYYVRCVRGGQSSPSFTNNGNDTVTDNVTGLIWQQGEPGSMTWANALSYCEGLNLGEHSDWRLPNIKELESITDDTQYSPAIDTTYFPNTNEDYYWSSTTYAKVTRNAWYVYFTSGDVTYIGSDKSYSFYVRCVRGGTSTTTCTYSISPTSQTFTSTGGTGSVAVTASSSSCAWTATESLDWVSITSDSSGTGSGTVSYSVSTNATGATRTGTMIIAGQTFTITQTAASCTYTISPTSQSFASSGGTGSVAVTASSNSCAWTVSESLDWVTITSDSSGSGSGTVSYSVSENTNWFTGPRTGNITIAGQTFTITQGRGNCSYNSYSITPTSATYDSSGGTGSVSVTTGAGCSWGWLYSLSWASITSSSGTGGGSGTVNYTVSTNATGATRTGTMTIADQTFTLTQYGAATYNLTVSINPSGGGTVKGSGINCPGTCSSTYNAGASVKLTAIASKGYQFSNWTGCDAASSNTCNLTMDADKALTADFTTCSNQPARIVGVTTVYYTTLQDAYNAAADGDLIQSQGVVFLEDLNLNLNKTVTIKTGYDCNYTTNSTNSGLSGTLVITNGTIIIENMVLQ